jgi:hypothetical protein
MGGAKLTTERVKFEKHEMSKIRGIKNYQSWHCTRTCIPVYCNSLETTLTTTPGPGLTPILLISDVVDKLNQLYPKTPFPIVPNCEV